MKTPDRAARLWPPANLGLFEEQAIWVVYNAFREPKHVHLDYVQERTPDWFPYAKRPVA
jgi:hypothetical protein